MMKTKFTAMVCGLVIALGMTMAGVSFADPLVVVNGVRLSLAEIQTLERLHCGPIPSGYYWLDPNSGIWGYAGNPVPQGHIADNCPRQPRRRSLSERRMLYYPGEILTH